jgi:hypothetical protein
MVGVDFAAFYRHSFRIVAPLMHQTAPRALLYRCSLTPAHKARQMWLVSLFVRGVGFVRV